MISRIAFCSLAVPAPAGWATTSATGSWIWAQKETPSCGHFCMEKKQIHDKVQFRLQISVPI